MQKINSIAQSMIDESLRKMVLLHGFSPEETNYVTIEVKEERVVFLVHDRLKMLIEKQLTDHKPKHASVSFDNYEGNLWHIIIENDGLESFFFSRQLQQVLKRLNTKASKERNIESNIELIREALSKAIKKSNSKAPCAPEISFENKTYMVTLMVNNIPLKLTEKNIDMVLQKISRTFPGLIEEFSKIQNLDLSKHPGIVIALN